MIGKELCLRCNLDGVCCLKKQAEEIVAANLPETRQKIDEIIDEARGSYCTCKREIENIKTNL